MWKDSAAWDLQIDFISIFGASAPCVWFVLYEESEWDFVLQAWLEMRSEVNYHLKYLRFNNYKV